MGIIIACIVVLTFISLTVVSRITGRRRGIERIIGEFDKPPDPKRFNEIESIAAFYLVTGGSAAGGIDDITWNDLDMDGIFDRLNTCQSSVGEEYLYALLRRGLGGDEELFRRALELLGGDRELRINVCERLRNLGFMNYNAVAETFFGEKSAAAEGNETVYKLLPFLPIAAAAAGLIFGGTGAVLGFIAGSIVNMVIYYKTSYKFAADIGMMKYLCGILYCGKSLGGLSSEPLISGLSEMFEPFAKIAARLSRVGKQPTSDTSDIFEMYINLATFKDINMFFEVKRIAAENGGGIRKIYGRIGLLDAACAVLNFRGSCGKYCEPVFTEERKICFKDLTHPLIKNAVGNDFEMEGNILVTGSNASGKSSFIKAAAANAVLAQSVLTCTAESFCLRRCGVMTSMAVRDDICAGDSYFTAEIKSMRRIIEAARAGYCFCVIDEILRGTNTAERIAASVSVLTALAGTESLCAAATHDIELTDIMAEKYRNVHFTERIEDGGVIFDYKIKEGAARTRNAIRLMKINGFPDEIIDMAERLVEGK
ncbi:MAG: hypothetical protein NC253_13835 [Ruminococcus sp.]|nr:hypothetical protein [Ruminococcus sp.]MCM1479809.1 hypothetical protein [Muribaculaceae bacterium]